MVRKNIKNDLTGIKAITVEKRTHYTSIGYMTESGHHTIRVPNDCLDWLVRHF